MFDIFIGLLLTAFLIGIVAGFGIRFIFAMILKAGTRG